MAIKVLANVFSYTAARDLTLANGTVIPAGTTIILVPHTTARAVTYGEQSLETYLPGLEAALADYQTELINFTARQTNFESVVPELEHSVGGYQAELINLTDRLTALETVMAELLSWAKAQGYEGRGLTNEASASQE